MLTQAVVSMPLVAVLYTRLAKTRARAAELGGALGAALFTGLPLAVGTWIAAPDVARVLLAGAGAGAGEPAAETLAWCLRAAVGAIALGAYGSVVVRAFYVAGDPWSPLCIGGLLSIAVNAVLDALVVTRFGVVGLAAVTSARPHRSAM